MILISHFENIKLGFFRKKIFFTSIYKTVSFCFTLKAMASNSHQHLASPEYVSQFDAINDKIKLLKNKILSFGINEHEIFLYMSDVYLWRQGIHNPNPKLPENHIAKETFLREMKQINDSIDNLKGQISSEERALRQAKEALKTWGENPLSDPQIIRQIQNLERSSQQNLTQLFPSLQCMIHKLYALQEKIPVDINSFYSLIGPLYEELEILLETRTEMRIAPLVKTKDS